MSSTDNPPVPSSIPDLDRQYNLAELTGALLRDAGITSGHYELVVQFRVSSGRVAGDDRAPLPGVALSVASVGLKRVDDESPIAVDAATLKVVKRKTSGKEAKSDPESS